MNRARRGSAWRGKAGFYITHATQDRILRGEAGYGRVWLGAARSGRARQSKAGQGFHMTFRTQAGENGKYAIDTTP